MKGKVDFRIPIIIILTIILIIMCYFYFKEDNIQSMENFDFDFSEISENFNNNSNSNKIILSTTSEVTTSLSENVELHATYYLEESYVETNQKIKSGENILKYTNDKYLTAPYDCVVTNISSTASNGRFTVTVEFENDGEILLGMTANVTI